MLVQLRKVVKTGSGKCWFQACLCSLLLWYPDKLQNVSELRAPQPFFYEGKIGSDVSKALWERGQLE